MTPAGGGSFTAPGRGWPGEPSRLRATGAAVERRAIDRHSLVHRRRGRRRRAAYYRATMPPDGSPELLFHSWRRRRPPVRHRHGDRAAAPAHRVTIGPAADHRRQPPRVSGCGDIGASVGGRYAAPGWYDGPCVPSASAGATRCSGAGRHHVPTAHGRCRTLVWL